MAALPTPSRAVRARACATVLVYATGVIGVPILHAALEVSRSAAAFEVQHAAGGPVLHAGELCAAVASLFVSMPSRAPVGNQEPRARVTLRAERPARPAPHPSLSTPEARAPPTA